MFKRTFCLYTAEDISFKGYIFSVLKLIFTVSFLIPLCLLSTIKRCKSSIDLLLLLAAPVYFGLSISYVENLFIDILGYHTSGGNAML